MEIRAEISFYADVRGKVVEGEHRELRRHNDRIVRKHLTECMSVVINVAELRPSQSRLSQLCEVVGGNLFRSRAQSVCIYFGAKFDAGRRLKAIEIVRVLHTPELPPSIADDDLARERNRLYQKAPP